MKHSIKIFLLCLFAGFFLSSEFSLAEEVEEAEDSGKRLEEVIVYGQRTEASVSDTSISITAMNQDFLEDMGVQGPDELINFIPATTRTSWDIKIRGVGRNFRGLGGDPGVGTYYNGIYSPDFGIASTEGGLFDIKRIEVLRGPQGTLYGRNSIGGVLNYVTNQPNHDEFESKVRVVLGEYNTNEWYGVASGPINDSIAYRLVASQRNSDGRFEGMGDAIDTEDINDRNVALILDWNISDSLSLNFRLNDRYSDRAGNFGTGGHGIMSEGPCISTTGAPVTDLDQCDPNYRVARDTNHYVRGLRVVDAAFPGAFPYVHPTTGAQVFAYYKREGVDPTVWPYSPSGNYQDPLVAAYSGGDIDEPDFKSLTNPFVNEEFDHMAASVVMEWDIDDRMALHYLGNYQDFTYWFDRDNDFSSSNVSSMGDTVVEGVWSFSHELRLFWELGDRWSATTGLYYFLENRDQDYGIRNRLGKGFVNDPAIYGPAGNETWMLDALAVSGGWVIPECFDWKNAEIGGPEGYGKYCGDSGVAHSQKDDIGAVYETMNTVETDNIAFYTQGDLVINDSWSVTLGLRYSEDRRTALEQRGGYSEIEFTDAAYPWIPWALWNATASAPAGFDLNQFWGPGVTPLAAMNVAMGAATFTGDPTGENPIAPVCALTAETCDRPLRLGGLPISFGNRTAGKYETDFTSYRVNFNWTPVDDMLVYFGVTTGYRAGGYDMGNDNRVFVDLNKDGDPLTTDPDTTILTNFDDEELTSYEIGYKSTHFDGSVQVTAAVYLYDYKNYQDMVDKWETSASYTLPPGLPPAPGRGPVETTINIPEATNKGFEMDALWLATDSFTVGGNYSYTLSEWDSSFTLLNENDPRYPLDVFGVGGSEDPCTLGEDIRALYCLDASGEQLSGIPKHKATLWGSYEWTLDAGKLTFFTSFAYTGEFYTSPFGRPWDEVPERYRTDMRLTFNAADESWSASFFVDNVLDDTYARWSDMHARLTGYTANYPQRMITVAPRFIGMEFSMNFGSW